MLGAFAVQYPEMHVFKTILQTLFRFFPFPTQTGLRVIGHPGPEAPVLLTCNFDLTVRRLLRALEGVDCFLLVANSKGINVWCASVGGMLNAHAVISVLKTSRIAERVHHRRLILPQLAAAGVDVAQVEQETGWHCSFGPVYARDIPAYLADGYRKTPQMRRVVFPLAQRLEMAVAWATMLSLLVGIPTAIINARSLPGVLALLWGFPLVLFGGYGPVMRCLPGPVGVVKTLLLGLTGAAGLVVWSSVIGHWEIGRLVGWGLGILAVALVLGFDLEGMSPLDASATVAYWGRRWPRTLDLWAGFGFAFEPWFTLRVDADRCTGCATCVEVCPKGVYELSGRKSRVARMDDCVQCTACLRQCPTGAIMAAPG